MTEGVLFCQFLHVICLRGLSFRCIFMFFFNLQGGPLLFHFFSILVNKNWRERSPQIYLNVAEHTFLPTLLC